MNLRNLFKKTWSAGLLIFSMLAFKSNNKVEEIVDAISEEEDPTKQKPLKK